MVRGRVYRLWCHVLKISLFVRLKTLGYSLILPLLGASSVESTISPHLLAGLLGIALTFHLFTYVFNDVVDVDVDRTAPQRGEFPLVKGEIKPHTALFFAISQIPLAFMLSIHLTENRQIHALLGTGFLLMAIYNLWGKKAFLPPMTDLLQGVAWGSLVLYGALVLTDQINSLVLTIFAYQVLLILLVNGVHASLRDLPNDLICGKRTTAIMFGVRPHEKKLYIPNSFRTYAKGCHTLLIGLTVLLLIENSRELSPLAGKMTLLMMILTISSVLILFKHCLNLIDSPYIIENYNKFIDTGILHMSILVSIPGSLLLLKMDIRTRCIFLITYLSPTILVNILTGKYAFTEKLPTVSQFKALLIGLWSNHNVAR